MMTAPAPAFVEERSGGRERRCIVTQEVRPESELIRFVVGPEGEIVPDVVAKLPGRGMWVTARREILERAVRKGHFSRAAKMPVAVPDDLVARVESLLVARMAGDLGLARRAGELVQGFEKVAQALAGRKPPAVLVEASDGSGDGRRKLLALANEPRPALIDCLTSAELSLALGRENVVHAALKSGRLSERLTADAGRVSGFRPSHCCAVGAGDVAAGSGPAGNKGQE